MKISSRVNFRTGDYVGINVLHSPNRAAFAVSSGTGYRKPSSVAELQFPAVLVAMINGIGKIQVVLGLWSQLSPDFM